MNLEELFETSRKEEYALLAKKLDAQEHHFKRNSQHIYEAIQNQNMETHSLIFLYCIASMDIKINFNLFDRFLKSLKNGKQVLFQIEKLYKVADEYKQFMLEQGIGVKAIKALEIVIQSLEAEGLGFTKIHLLFVDTCLFTRMYKSALRIIEKPLIHIENRSKTSEAEFFAFQYWSGCVYLGLQRNQEAQQCFELVVSLSTRELYEVTIDSVKKLFFLEFLLGKNQIKRREEYQMISIRLIELLQNVLNLAVKDSVSYLDFLDKNRAELCADGNYGLAKKINIVFTTKQLKKISKTFLREYIRNIECIKDYKDVTELQIQVNEQERLFKIDRKLSCIDFINGEDIDHEQSVLVPLKNLFALMKSIKEEQELDNLQGFNKITNSDVKFPGL